MDTLKQLGIPQKQLNIILKSQRVQDAIVLERKYILERDEKEMIRTMKAKEKLELKEAKKLAKSLVTPEEKALIAKQKRLAKKELTLENLTHANDLINAESIKTPLLSV